ncbi:MAG: putative PEP-binding protein [Thermomicrobiales bacterium]
MIELPRAALVADEIAKQADFFSFGTNDLTQTTYGLSRDDSSGSCRCTSNAASSRQIPS